MAYKALVVDDEPLLWAYVRELLEEAGHEVEEAACADEAIVLLEQGAIGFVITDIEMPGRLNGLDLAWMIRVRWPTLPVVVASGRRLPKPDDLPANIPVLTKPFSAERLLDVIRQIAGQ